MYVYPVPDAWSLGLMPVPEAVAIPYLVSAVCGKRTVCVVADHLVNGLVRYLHTHLCQVAGYLLGRPLLPSDELLYTPGERLTHGTVPRSMMHTAPRKDIGLVPDILTVHCRIAS